MTTALRDSATTLSPEEGVQAKRSLWWTLTIGVFVCMAIVESVVGNLLILLAYRRDPHLRGVHNLYIVHLAICNLVIGTVSMPFYLVYTLRNWDWPYGGMACKLFLALDTTVCRMTLLVVVLIAWDRLAMLRHWAAYKTIETLSKAYLRLGAAWVISVLFNVPPVLLWDVVTGVSVVPSRKCLEEYIDILFFVIFKTLIQVLFPFVSLIVLHVLIFFALRKRLEQMKVQNVVVEKHRMPGTTASCTSIRGVESENVERPGSSLADTTGSSAPVPTTIVKALPETCENQENKVDVPVLNIPALEPVSSVSTAPTVVMTPSSDLDKPGATDNLSSNNVITDGPPSEEACSMFPNLAATTPEIAEQDKVQQARINDRHRYDARENRIAWMEAGLVLALVITWVPFHLSKLIYSGCPTCINMDLFESCGWLLWFKSCLDPMLYAYSSHRFRLNLRQMLADNCSFYF